MTNHFRSSTLIALAAGAFAADPIQQVPVVPIFKDSDLKLTIGGQIQFRTDWSKAQDCSGQPYDVANATSGKSDDLDFYLRRCRLFVKGVYGDYSLNFGIRADNMDRQNNSSTNTTMSTAAGGQGSGRTFEIHYASLTRKWKGDVTQYLQLGFDYAFFNAASSGPSSSLLLAGNRATETLLAPRGAGIGYRLDAGMFFFGVDVQNNNKVLNGSGDDVGTTSSSYQAEGLCYTTRLEFTPEGDWAIKPKDYKESFAGKVGTGWMMAVEAGYNAHDVEAAGNSAGGAERGRWRDTLVIGAESLLHLDSLSALIEYRWARQTTNSDRGEVENAATATPAIGDNPRYAGIFIIQAGYALPCPLFDGAIFEPAVRYTNMDYNRSGKESASFGSNDYAAASSSGNQFDLGVNWYPSAGVVNNKVSLLWTHWVGEALRSDTAGAPVAGDDYKAKADIVRVQYQWLF